MEITYLGSGIWSYRTFVRRAIFKVRVPAIIIMSDCRGVARGTAPKRSRSALGPPVCIISIAQQAKPNSIYQTEDLRLQLSISSTLVVMTISGMVLISDMHPPESRLLR